ncbi:putative sporulation protein YtxC [Pseudoneobacillus sp. C159]
MVEIIFQNKEDVNRLYSKLKEKILFCDEILLLEERQTIKINVGLLDEHFKNAVTEVFFEFIYRTKRDDWLRQILTEQFFYSDPEEQDHILSIVYSIMEGENEELADFIGNSMDGTTIRKAVRDLLQDSNIAFSFEAFVRFRLRDFQEKLLNFVEISLDEYKMEQEYQVFIQTLREFLRGRPEKMTRLSLVYEDEPIFYNEKLEEMKRSEVARMIDRKLLSNHPIYVDSVTIAPLLSMAPREIFLYTADVEEPVIRTIKNIFEERVILLPLEQFKHQHQ